MWIDSHAHLDAAAADGSLDGMLARMHEAGVSDVVAIGGTVQANARAVDLSREYAAIHAVAGYDRDEAGKDWDREALLTLVADGPVVGIGETGLDYYYSRDTASAQCALLEAMLDVACERGLPVVIHTREAEEDTLNLLRTYVSRWRGAGDCPGVIHCYTGGSAFARSLMDLGMMISFSGIVTFKNATDLRDVLRLVPDDYLLIETDAPYLAPVPKRGKPNEPANVRYVGEFIARTVQRPVEEIAEITTQNAQRLFRLDKS